MKSHPLCQIVVKAHHRRLRQRRQLHPRIKAVRQFQVTVFHLKGIRAHSLAWFLNLIWGQTPEHFAPSNVLGSDPSYIAERGGQMQPHMIVFTDLDGTLLDHDSYSWRAAKPAMARLGANGIPLIFNSSKTAAEISELQSRMGLRGPFIAGTARRW